MEWKIASDPSFIDIFWSEFGTDGTQILKCEVIYFFIRILKTVCKKFRYVLPSFSNRNFKDMTCRCIMTSGLLVLVKKIKISCWKNEIVADSYRNSKNTRPNQKFFDIEKRSEIEFFSPSARGSLPMLPPTWLLKVNG